MSDFQIQKLIWDSTFFGYKIGKVEINSILNVKDLINTIKNSPFDMVQVFSNQNLESVFKQNPIDLKLTYSKKVATATTNNHCIKSVNKEFPIACGASTKSCVAITNIFLLFFFMFIFFISFPKGLFVI